MRIRNTAGQLLQCAVQVGGKDSKTSSQQQQGGTKVMDQKRKQLLWNMELESISHTAKVRTPINTNVSGTGTIPPFAKASWAVLLLVIIFILWRIGSIFVLQD
jgi:hypothetical protein